MNPSALVSFNNYRPVSNLSFLSKTLERVVADLWEPFQSAYRKGHSTESALLRIQTDIRTALGQKKVVLMAMLDLSAAFDTVDHDLLLATLSSIGIQGVALQWFQSYLNDRKQCVTIQASRSNAQPLRSGVPQGSVIGPILFNVYTRSLGALLRAHNVMYHLYADDAQIYLACDPLDIAAAKTHLEECISAVQIWMAQHKLKLNDDKTDFMVFANKETAKRIEQQVLCVGGCDIPQSHSVKNVGFTMNASLTCDEQVKAVCRVGYAQLKALSKIKPFVDRASLETIVHTLITTRIDYCNALHYGASQSTLQKLQLLQNSCARLLSGAKRHEHVTPILFELHWLPVKERVAFKTFVMIYNCLQHRGPSYLSELIHPHQPVRPMRHHDNLLLEVPFTRCNYLYTTCFTCYAPRLWNSLPYSIRSVNSLDVFKQRLKTHLFILYFNA